MELFEKYKKWTKVNTCFSFNIPTEQDILHFLGWLLITTQILLPKKFITNIDKIVFNVQKMLKGASGKADFWHGEN